MGLTGIDGFMLKKMIIAGSNELLRHKQIIDSMNVFPVPDGDTGTNMSLTMRVAAGEVEKLNTPNGCDVAKAASSGSLRGARGNSGVILSQLFRGFAKGVENKARIDAHDAAYALAKAAETAYKAVMKPKEGTILTVAAALAQKAAEVALDTDDISELMEALVAHGNEVLAKTPRMLPELELAGVVDAGGKGLMCILEGAYKSLGMTGDIALVEPAHATDGGAFIGMDVKNIEFGYCTEFFINVPKVTEEVENRLRNYFQTVGDSIVVVGDEDIFKVHVHTEHPGNVLEYALKIGALSNMKIENMRLQHSNMINFAEQSHKTQPRVLPGETGFIAVAAGKGLEAYFQGLGVDVVIEGGQTMNPSIEDILAAADRINAGDIFVLPNNTNIILAANQAAELSIGKKLHVLPTKTIPQGIAAMVEYLPIRAVSENFENMKAAISRVKTGQVTYAARHSSYDGKEIKEGDILCMFEGAIALTHSDVQEGAKALADKMLAEGADIMSVYYGHDTTAETACALGEYIAEKYPDVEVEVMDGGQPLYYYIFAVE